MKSIKLLASALMLAAATTASAQFVNSGSNTTATTPGGPRNVDLTGWQRVTVSFNPVKITSDDDDIDPLKMTGISVGYAKGFNIAKQLPLFLEAGINAQFAFKTIDSEDAEDGIAFTQPYVDVPNSPFSGGTYKVENKFMTMNLNIPINLAYKFTFNNGKTSLVPYAGINFKFNILGKRKYNLEDSDELGDDYDEDDFWNYMEDPEGWNKRHDNDGSNGYGNIDTYQNSSNNNYNTSGSGSEGTKQSANMFDKKDTGDKDLTWKRFQMGWQIGLGLYHNQYYVGVGYTKDFTELCKKTKVGYANISVGYCF